MSYIGTAPTIGNFQVCDAISTVNGQASYTMLVGGVNATPQSANHMLVSLNGILQKPNSSFTVSGSTITFASNLVTGDVIDFIQILGNVLDLGVPSDATVSLAKLTATGTKSSSTFLRGDNTFAEAGGGSLNLISAQTASSASTLTFTSSHITSTYKVYQLHCIDVVQSSDGGNLGFEVSPNNGSSYVQSGYLNIRFISNQTNGANSILSSAGTGDTNVKICGAGEGIGANGNESAQSIITLFNPLGAKAKLFKSDGVQLNSSGQLNMQRHLYGLDQSATYNNIKIVPNSGTFSGTFILYGVTAS